MNAPSEQPPSDGNDPQPPATPANPSSQTDNDPAIPDTAVVHQVFADHEIPPDQPTVTDKVKTLLVGKPLNLSDRSVYQHISLVAFLAWVGLGADGLSSSCYGPSEAFGHLQAHYHLGIFLALATMFTVWVISACYSHIIEAFPSGGAAISSRAKCLALHSASSPARH